MPDWDENSPKLSANLAALMKELRDAAPRRAELSCSDARSWHARAMEGLTPDHPKMVGAFRGEPDMNYDVWVGPNKGAPPLQVASELGKFETVLQSLIERLDRNIPVGAKLTDNQIEAILAACGWVHAEWVRVHPFANGNGRTARIWANVIAMRYGLPPFVRLRPRPEGSKYGEAGAAAMQGDHNPTVEHFKQLFEAFISK